MKLKSLRLRGAIGIQDGLGLEELNVDFSQFSPGIICISGPNGAGKSTFVENLTPYRMLFSRSGSLAKQFYLKDSCRDLLVGMNGDEYRILINVNADSSKLESYLYKNGEIVNADGKENSYNEAAYKLFGEPELFFSSLFMPQKRLPFSKLPPVRRKELFLELTGQHLIQAKCEFASDQSKGLRERYVSLQTERKSVTDALDRLGDVAGEIDAIELEIKSLVKNMGIYEGEIVALNADVEFLQAEVTQQAVTKEKIDALRIREKILNSDLSELKLEYSQRLSRLENEQGVCQNQSNLIAGILAPEKLIQLDSDIEEAERVKAEYLSLQEKQIPYNNFGKDIDAVRQQLKFVHEKGASDLKYLQEQLKAKLRSAGLLDKVPCQTMGPEVADPCSKCPLLTDAVKAKDEIADTELSIKKCEEQTAKKAIELNSKFNELLGGQNLLGFDPDTFLKTQALHRKWQGENPAVKKVEFEKAAAKLARLTDDIARLTAEWSALNQEKEARLKDLEEKLGAIKIDLLALSYDPELESKLVVIQCKRDYVIRSQNEARELIASKQSKLETLNASKGQAAELTAERDQLSAKLGQLEIEIADYDHLSLMLSRNGGFQSYLVEAAGKEMSPFCNALLANYGVPWTMEIRTSKPDAKGTKEVDGFYVFINTPTGQRELGDLSGGQEVWIDTILYHAVADMLRRRSGLHLQTKILDEADGALDGERAIAYLNALSAAHKESGLHHTLLISHRPEIQQMIDQQIRFIAGKGIEIEVA